MGWLDLFGGNSTNQNVTNTSTINNTSSTDISKTFNAMFSQNISQSPNPTQAAVANVANSYANALNGLGVSATNFSSAIASNLYPSTSGGVSMGFIVVAVVIGYFVFVRRGH